MWYFYKILVTNARPSEGDNYKHSSNDGSQWSIFTEDFVQEAGLKTLHTCAHMH